MKAVLKKDCLFYSAQISDGSDKRMSIVIGKSAKVLKKNQTLCRTVLI